jgi:hypothetical protein
MKTVSLFLVLFLLGPTIGVLPRPSSGRRVWGRLVGTLPRRMLVSPHVSPLTSVGSSGNPLPRTSLCGIVPTIPLVSVELGVLVVLVLVLPGHRCLVVATAIVPLLFVVALLIHFPGGKLGLLKANLLSRVLELVDEEAGADLELEKLQEKQRDVLRQKKILRGKRLALKAKFGALSKQEQEMYNRELASIEEQERLERAATDKGSEPALSPGPSGPSVPFDCPSVWMEGLPELDSASEQFFSEFLSVGGSGGTPSTSGNS